MKYAASLPLTALVAISLITWLVQQGLIPPGMEILEAINTRAGDYFYPLIFLIILLESIVYVGFYFPGQFFAVVLVVLSEPDIGDILALTLCMVGAATLGSGVNYILGCAIGKPDKAHQPSKLKHLLLAMIHMNSLAFFMFAQGASGRPSRIVWLAGLLNLPYYLLLIAATAYLSEEIMHIAESTWLLIGLISVWLLIALYLDFKRYRAGRSPV